MKWIKSIDRLPEDRSKQYYYIADDGSKGYDSMLIDKNGYWRNYNGCKVTYWLDESIPPVEEGSSVEEASWKAWEKINKELRSTHGVNPYAYNYGFKDGVSYAAQQTAKYREALERIKQVSAIAVNSPDFITI